VSSNVSERQAGEVAEAARELEWKLPSFGKELFLGNFRGERPVPAEQALRNMRGALRPSSASSGTTTTTPTGRRRLACWMAATGGSRRGSSTPRARVR